MQGKSTRLGVRKCYECRKPFTVKVGTIFEASHVPLRLWLQAIHLICSSKKGISANQLHRILGVTLKTAWFMGHRIREAMRVAALRLWAATAKIVEVDETYIGTKEGAEVRQGGWASQDGGRLTLVERVGSPARSSWIPRPRKKSFRSSGDLARESARYDRRSEPLFQDRRRVREARCRGSLAARNTATPIETAALRSIPTLSKATTRFSSAA